MKVYRRGVKRAIERLKVLLIGISGLKISRGDFRRFLDVYKGFAYRGLGARIDKRGFKELDVLLEKARIRMSTGMFLSIAIMNSLAIALIILPLARILIPMPLLLLFPAFFALSFSAQLVYPIFRARRRAKRIDDVLPYAFSYMATLASAGVPPQGIFKSLAGAKEIYEEISVEASYIVRDMEVLGFDVLSALANAAKRAPSPKLEAVLNTIISSVTAGSDLSEVLVEVSEVLMEERRLLLRRFIEDVAIYSEFYVVLCVLGPLFVLIMLPVTTAVNLITGTKGTLAALLGSEFAFLASIYILIPFGSILFLLFMDAVMPPDIKG
ncbi:MAG: hypothetical protein DRN91_08975 [Candidatus Alkanophagales archaeon]|nr:MAG: hypothetical protein DRN91_08975 [Candidatus Alkanophagales archaeon]